jgi:hypothetical protein
MKKMHIDYFTKQEKNGNKKLAFLEKYEKSFIPRTKKLPND